MKLNIRKVAVPFMFAGALAFCLSAAAQQTASSNAQGFESYSVSREVSLIGTVVKYNAASTTPPIGAHVLLQTSSGQVDVHLGNAKLLQASHFELNAGDNIRIVGENLSYGNGAFFAARIVQKGTQAVAVRNTKGFPLTAASVLTQDQKDALRGAR